jgi:hypothetical protein
MKYSINLTLKKINADERCYKIVDRYLPGIRDTLSQQPMAENLPLRKIAEYAKGMIPDSVLQILDEELNKLNDGSLSPAEERTIKQYQEMAAQRETTSPTVAPHKQDAIYPGKVWLDTNGSRIQAHGGAVYYEDGFYYWYGENKEYTTGKTDVWSWGIRCYKSSDLCNWDDLGLIIEPDTTNPGSGLFPDAYVDRPHIIKCEKTGRYVCWIKLSGQTACFIILTADKFLGPYTMIRENYRPFDYEVGDFDIHVDNATGKAYLFETGSRDGAFGVYGMELSEDFCQVEKFLSAQYENILPPLTREGITLFEYENKKYLVTSGMTGYIPNPSDVAVSDSWETPFISIGNPHINDMSKASFNSQISQIFKLHGSEQMIAIADRWMPEELLDGELSDNLRRFITQQLLAVGDRSMPEGAPDGEVSEKLQSLIVSAHNPDETELTAAQREKIMAI